MDPTSSAMVNLALPEWVSVEPVPTPAALGEETSPSFLGSVVTGDPPAEINWINLQDPPPESWEVITDDASDGPEEGVIQASEFVLDSVKFEFQPLPYVVTAGLDPLTGETVIRCGMPPEEATTSIPEQEGEAVDGTPFATENTGIGQSESSSSTETILESNYDNNSIGADNPDPLSPVLEATHIGSESTKPELDIARDAGDLIGNASDLGGATDDGEAHSTDALLPPESIRTSKPEPIDPAVEETPTITDCWGIIPEDERLIPPAGEVEPQPEVPSLPNVVLHDVVVPALASVGDRLDISWTYSIHGTTPNNWLASYCSVTYSKNDVFGDEDDVLFTTLYGSNFGSDIPLDSLITSTQFAFPMANFAGDGFLFFKQDGFNYVDESDENDNLLMKPITIVLPNLSISNVIAPSQIVSGALIQVSWTVTNEGEQALVNPFYYDTIVFSANDVYGDEDDIHVTVNYQTSSWGAPLQPQESIVVNQDIYLPGNAVGEGYLFFAVDASNSLAETDESDNVLSQAITIFQPNLSITNVAAPSQVIEGNHIDVSWTVANLGEYAVDFYRTFGNIVFSKNEIYGDEDDVFLNGGFSFGFYSRMFFESEFDDFPPSEHEVIFQSLTIPMGFFGEGYLLFKTDAGEVLNETNEMDNIYSHQISIVQRDVSVLGISTPGSVSAGSTFNVSLDLRNDGDGAVNNFAPAKLVFSTNQVMGDEDDINISNFPFYKIGLFIGGIQPNAQPVDLNPGTSQTIDYSVHIPYYLSGNGYLLIQSDSGEVASAALDITSYDYEMDDSIYHGGFCGVGMHHIGTTYTPTLQTITIDEVGTNTAEGADVGAQVKRGTIGQDIPPPSLPSLQEMVSDLTPEISTAAVGIPPSEGLTNASSDGPNESFSQTTLLDLLLVLMNNSVLTPAEEDSSPTSGASFPSEAVLTEPTVSTASKLSSQAASVGLALSLLETQGVSPGQVGGRASQGDLSEDPLSGMKLGELVSPL
jgi:hypothetical protein